MYVNTYGVSARRADWRARAHSHSHSHSLFSRNKCLCFWVIDAQHFKYNTVLHKINCYYFRWLRVRVIMWALFSQLIQIFYLTISILKIRAIDLMKKYISVQMSIVNSFAIKREKKRNRILKKMTILPCDEPMFVPQTFGIILPITNTKILIIIVKLTHKQQLRNVCLFPFFFFGLINIKLICYCLFQVLTALSASTTSQTIAKFGKYCWPNFWAHSF